MEPYFIAAWILTGIIAAVAIGYAVYQHKTGKQWSDEKKTAVMNALKGVGNTVTKAIQDGTITKEEARCILESVIYVLAAVMATDTGSAAKTIPGASEQINMLLPDSPVDHTEIKAED